MVEAAEVFWLFKLFYFFIAKLKIALRIPSDTFHISELYLQTPVSQYLLREMQKDERWSLRGVKLTVFLPKKWKHASWLPGLLVFTAATPEQWCTAFVYSLNHLHFAVQTFKASAACLSRRRFPVWRFVRFVCQLWKPDLCRSWARSFNSSTWDVKVNLIKNGMLLNESITELKYVLQWIYVFNVTAARFTCSHYTKARLCREWVYQLLQAEVWILHGQNHLGRSASVT